MNQKKVLGLLFALIATVFMFILVVSALPSDVYETPGIINGGIYTITNTRSGKNLDIYNNGRFDNTSVIQFKANSTKNNQKFRIDYHGNGLYTITAMNSLKLLTVQNAVNQDEVPVVIHSVSATSASNGGQYEGQYFKIRANSDGTFTFLTMASNYTKVLDVYSAVNNGQNNGEVLQQHTEIGTANQRFRLTLCDTIGFETSTSTESTSVIYRIKNLYSGRYLDVYGATASSGTNVQTYTYHSGDSLKWTIRKASDTKNGEYRLFTEIGNYGSFVLNVDSATNNCNISSTKNTQSVFYIIRINDGSNKGLYYIKFGNQYLSQETGTSYNVKLTSSAGTNSLWSFEKVSDLSAVIFTNKYDTYSTENSGNEVKDALDSISYPYTIYKNLGSSTAAVNYMNSSPAMAFHFGHGAAGRICFYQNSDTHENLYEDNILDLQLNEYANIACFISIGCSSGLPGGYGIRFPDAMYERGVSYALCFTESTYNETFFNNPNVSKWFKAFMTEAKKGKKIEECVEAGNQALNGFFTDPYTYYAVGDDQQILIH